MTNPVAVGATALFVVLTLALAVNLTGFQGGTRELAPAPLAQLSLARVASPGEPGGDGLVIINSAGPQSREAASGVQRELTALGYRPGPSDGNVSLMTQAAVMAFEYDSGLPLTAAVDDSQLQRLLLGTGRVAAASNANAGLPSTSQAAAVMQVVQRSLQELGYEPGPVDGTYSAETERAIRNLETDHNLPETGRVSGRLVQTLSILQARGQVRLSQR
ncbi:MAG: peptidoglycan-binding protein [Alphaproteobacteria bacterium]|nr:peptidoglycan-binding protein [Alphaproteobacteria bacterium]